MTTQRHENYSNSERDKIERNKIRLCYCNRIRIALQNETKKWRELVRNQWEITKVIG